MPEVLAGRYRLISLAGRGVSAEVWQAHDERLDRQVAVKLFRLDRTDLDSKTLERVLNEARIAATLNHPNAVVIHDVDATSAAEGPFIVMEYVNGISLEQRLRAGPLAEHDSLGVVRDIAEALYAAHAEGIRHRDIKPSNVLLAPNGSAKLADFGISRGVDAVTLTDEDGLVGTLAYMPPEVARGERPTAASDIWSLGATWYAMLEGHPPHVPHPESANPATVVADRVSLGAPESARAGEAQATLIAMLDPDPTARPDAERLLTVLHGSKTGHSPERQRRRRRTRKRMFVPILAALFVAGAATTGAILLGGSQGGSGATGTSGRAADPVPVRPAHPPLTGHQQVSVVRVQGGADAAVYRPHGGSVSFWSYRNGSWEQVADSSYPVEGHGSNTYDYGETTITGYLPSGSKTPVYLAEGGFSGDGFYNFVAFAFGRKGWGLLGASDSNHLESTGRGAVGTSWGEWNQLVFEHGVLETLALNTEGFTVADGGAFPLITRWGWRDDHFVRVGDNAFQAAEATAPVQPWKPGFRGCPVQATSGTYVGWLSARAIQTAGSGAEWSIELRIGPTAKSVVAFASSSCVRAIPATFPIVVQADSSVGGAGLITGPAWVMLTSGRFGPDDLLDSEAIHTGSSAYGPDPYSIPASLGVLTIASKLGFPTQQQPLVSSEPAKAQVTYANGVITGLAFIDGQD